MTIATVAAGTNSVSIAVTLNGKYAYMTNNGDSTVSQYSIGADGSLTPMTTPAVVAGSSPNSISVDPRGKYAYVANDSSSDTVSQYSIGADGSLARRWQRPTVAAEASPSLVHHCRPLSGKYAYVLHNSGTSTVSQYSIGADWQH